MTKLSTYEVEFQITASKSKTEITEQYKTYITARSKAEAFVMGRNEAEKVYARNGYTCTAIETYFHPKSKVTEITVTEAEINEVLNDPLFDKL